MKQKTRNFYRKLWLYMKINAGIVYISLIPIFTVIYMLPWVKLNVAKHTLMQCLYFSITIITTLGLGDIYPVNRWGQLMVSLEALLGVVLIGFYLSGLALKSSIRARSMSPEELDDFIELNKHWKNINPDYKLEDFAKDNKKEQ